MDDCGRWQRVTHLTKALNTLPALPHAPLFPSQCTSHCCCCSVSPSSNSNSIFGCTLTIFAFTRTCRNSNMPHSPKMTSGCPCSCPCPCPTPPTLARLQLESVSRCMPGYQSDCGAWCCHSGLITAIDLWIFR